MAAVRGAVAPVVSEARAPKTPIRGIPGGLATEMPAAEVRQARLSRLAATNRTMAAVAAALEPSVSQGLCRALAALVSTCLRPSPAQSATQAGLEVAAVAPHTDAPTAIMVETRAARARPREAKGAVAREAAVPELMVWQALAVDAAVRSASTPTMRGMGALT